MPSWESVLRLPQWVALLALDSQISFSGSTKLPGQRNAK
jgi:hypothetical protein